MMTSNVKIVRFVFIGLMLSALGCSYERPPTYPEPPTSSYTTVTVTLKIGDATTSLQAALISPDFFGAAKVSPVLGRFFISGDHASPTRVVVLSNALWQRQFGASPGVIGQAVTLDGRAAVVVGIAPRGFESPNGTMLWLPKGAAAERNP